ncbi:MAG: glycosyltransferase family 1 protein [Candidatus Buchananbacteria bacterium]
MKIGLEASLANSPQRTGTEWYSYYLIQELKKLDLPGTEFVLYSPDKLQGDLAGLPKNFTSQVLGWPLKYFWKQLRLSWEMLINPPDVLLVPANTIPLILPHRTIATIHDVGFFRHPELYSLWERLYHTWSSNLALHRADKIIVISEFTKQEILHFRPNLDPSKLVVIAPGVNFDRYSVLNEPAVTNTTLNKYQLTKPFVLYVGRLEKKKNLANLLKAWQQLANPNLDLVLVGNRGLGYAEIAQEKLKIKNSQVHELGYVAETDLPILYNTASAFIFVSNYEGFGLPVLQAMACGTPVIAANNSSLPEVVGSAGLLVDPQQPQVIADAITKIITDKVLAKQLAEQGLERVKAFKWSTCALNTFKILKN